MKKSKIDTILSEFTIVATFELDDLCKKKFNHEKNHF